MEKIILGFVGEIASGKGTACDYIVKSYNAGYHKFSTILRNILDRLHKEHTRKNLQNLSTALRQALGEDLLADVITKDVAVDKAAIVCVDGIRRPTDIDHLQKMPNFFLIHVTADEKTRFNRLTKRTENKGDTNKTFEEFLQDQKAESEQLILEVAKEADYVIDNNGDFTDLQKQLDDMLKKIGYADKN